LTTEPSAHEVALDSPDYQRYSAYEVESQPGGPYQQFLDWSGNVEFRRSKATGIALFLLLIAYPIFSVAFAGDPEDLKLLENDTVLLFTLIATIMMQWMMFLLLYVATYREQTFLRGLGLKKLRGTDIAWAISFLLVANLILLALAWILAQLGMPMPGEIQFLIPEDTTGRIVWVMVSATAGFCEEIAFRGYLMTRLRILGKTKTWLMPVVVSSLTFGILHAYQSLPGVIILSVYGLMFALLYIRTRSLWPCIIAHFFQDFTALFIPQ